jgi:CBS-domain-containing membrane protein
MQPTVKDVMTTTRVAWVKKDASFRDMAAALREFRVSGFPVVDDDGKVIGVVSEADLLAKEALDSEPQWMPGMIAGRLRRKEHEKARGTTASDVMTSPPVTVTPDDTIERTARLMCTRKVRRVPVVDPDGRLIGIVSRSDLLSVFDRPDGDIRREILDQVIRRALLTDPAIFGVVVKDGIVTLSGNPESFSVGQEIAERARHVQGVVAVRDRFNYPPTPGRSDVSFDVLARFPAD